MNVEPRNQRPTMIPEPLSTNAGDRTLVTLLRARLGRAPDELVYGLLGENGVLEHELQARALDRRARALAAVLQDRLAPGARVVLAYPEGPEFLTAFVACLYAGVVAVPAAAPTGTRQSRALPRLRATLVDAEPALVLSSTEMAAALATPDGPALLVTDTVDDRHADSWRPHTPQPGDVAYLQYTSGSTTTPRGVMVTQRNFVCQLDQFNAMLPYQPDSRVVTWLPHSHDYGLVEGLLRPLCAGVPIYALTPWTFLRRPIAWLRAISHFRATCSGGPCFAYEHCLRHIRPDQRAELDLRSWRTATVGAEPLRLAVLQAFEAAFASSGFARGSFATGYGLAETTLMATLWPSVGMPVHTLERGDRHAELVSCGVPGPGNEIIIVDQEALQRRGDGEVGEIWVRGPSVAAGYWNQPATTQATFAARLATGEGPFLRTGDLGLMAGGELFVTGRVKELLIIYGQNYYPHDIEQALDGCHPALRPGQLAAFGEEVDGAEQLVVAFELERGQAGGADLAAVIEAVREAAASRIEPALVAVALLPPGGLPRTSSGKLQRLACQTAWRDGTLDARAIWRRGAALQADEPPESDLPALEAGLAELWGELLGQRPSSVNDNFFALGGDSLNALLMSVGVEERFGRSVPDTFFREPTVANLARLLRDQAVTTTAPAPSSVLPPLVSPPVAARIAPRLRRRLRDIVEARCLARPGPEGRALLAWWCRQPWFQRLAYPDSLRVVRGFLRHVGARPAAAASDTTAALLGDVVLRIDAMVSRRLGFDPAVQATDISALPRSILARDGTTVSAEVCIAGGTLLAEAVSRGRGVILLSYHSPALGLLPAVLHSAGHTQIGAISGSSAADPLAAMAQLTAQIQQAYQLLGKGGLLVVMGEGSYGRSGEVEAVLFGRRRAFKVGFAELALQSGAAVLPMVAAFDAAGRLCVSFAPPLDPGIPTTGRQARVEGLVEQYVAFLQRAWSVTPASVQLPFMRQFLLRGR